MHLFHYLAINSPGWPDTPISTVGGRCVQTSISDRLAASVSQVGDTGSGVSQLALKTEQIRHLISQQTKAVNHKDAAAQLPSLRDHHPPSAQ